MLFKLVAALLSASLVTAPCSAQLTQEQLRKSIEQNQDRYRQILEQDKQKYEKALAKANAEQDPALKTKLEFNAAKQATEIATDYERPNINAITNLPPDYVQARHWYGLGTQYGDTDGAYWLGQLYWDGHGGPVDRERAKDLWLWAAENGERKAVVKLEGLGYNMQKERDRAFGVAQHPDHTADAEKGLLLVLGALLISTAAHDINETPECREIRLSILAGTRPPPLPSNCY